MPTNSTSNPSYTLWCTGQPQPTNQPIDPAGTYTEKTLREEGEEGGKKKGGEESVWLIPLPDLPLPPGITS
jgi:hypothetical protein